jgi:fermentation-respiration switch protein FrsA (DUF1100 family)
MTLVLVVLVILAFLLGGSVFLSNYFFNFVLKRKSPMPGSAAYTEAEAARAASFANSGRELPWLDQAGCETVEIRSRDGLRLRGLWLSKPGNANTVILAHGYTGWVQQLSGFALYFYERAGFNILLPHARAHGASEGEYIGFGWLERPDYLDWIDWVKNRVAEETAGIAAADAAADGPEQKIVLYGISMGAATVMMVGGEESLPTEVKAIIEDCGYTSVQDELMFQMKARYHISSPSLLRRVDSLAKKKAGYSFEEASSLNQVKKIKIPVLFIHGGEDSFVPTEMVYPLYEACTAPKELYVVPGADHGLACEADPGEYERRVTQFLSKYVYEN